MKHVLITGAAQGLGLHLTQECLRRNYVVIATTRQAVFSSELLNLKGQFPEHLFLRPMDVLDPKLCTEQAQWLLQEFGSLDLLINNAAISWANPQASFADVKFNEWQNVISVNLLGPIQVTQTFLPLLQKSKSPQVVMISSALSLFSENKMGRFYSYRLSKVALNMLAQNLQIEFPNLDVRLIGPGHLKTRMGGASAPSEPADSAKRILNYLEEPKSKQFQLYDVFEGVCEW